MRIPASSFRDRRAARLVRVVVADDHAFFRATLAAELTAEEGFEVVGLAADGMEGLRLVRALEPDVALVDVKMPQIGGLRLCEMLTGARTRVVLMSGHCAEDLAELARAAGAVAFLPKTGTSGRRLRAAVLRAAQADGAGAA